MLSFLILDRNHAHPHVYKGWGVSYLAFSGFDRLVDYSQRVYGCAIVVEVAGLSRSI